MARAALVATLGAIGALMLAPSGAMAIDCELDIGSSSEGDDAGAILGGGSSWWETTDDGAIDEAGLFKPGGGLTRGDAYDEYASINIDAASYNNPDADDDGCTRTDGGRGLRYPTDELTPDVFITPELYFAKNRAMGRTLLKIRNAGAAAIEVDLLSDGDLGADDAANVDKSSSGNATANESDVWATSCEDPDSDGCANVAGEQLRDPELAHIWERKGAKRESADIVTLADGAGNFDVGFNDVTIGAGKTVSLMLIGTLHPKLKPARKAAAQIAKNPEDNGVFAGLSRQEQRQILNW